MQTIVIVNEESWSYVVSKVVGMKWSLLSSRSNTLPIIILLPKIYNIVSHEI